VLKHCLSWSKFVDTHLYHSDSALTYTYNILLPIVKVFTGLKGSLALLLLLLVVTSKWCHYRPSVGTSASHSRSSLGAGGGESRFVRRRRGWEVRPSSVLGPD